MGLPKWKCHATKGSQPLAADRALFLKSASKCSIAINVSPISYYSGAFSNAVYSDGERDSGVILPIQGNGQTQHSKSKENQVLANRSQQQPYQVQPNNYDDNYIDPNEVNGREHRKPTAPPDDTAEYIDVDSAIQRDRHSYAYVDCKVLNETANRSDPEYLELENPSKGSDPVDPVYFQLEKNDQEVKEQIVDKSLQDYGRLNATTAIPYAREDQRNAATSGETYQHLKSHVTPVSGNDDYQHLKRDGF